MSRYAIMNHALRLVCNELIGARVVASEPAFTYSKKSLATRAPFVLLMALGSGAAAQTAPPVNQLPVGGQVSAGTATLQQSATAGAAVLNIQQSTARAVINWQSFNVGSSAQVNFIQPSANSVTLNRVFDSNPSQIFGRITAPGQVFISNPQGVVFGPNASVNVGGLVATTHAISDADLMAGKTSFSRNGSTGSVVNQGSLTASLGGYIALLAPEVRNSGVIMARMGTVVMAAGETIELQFDAKNTLASIAVTPSQIKALVENQQAVLAPGGIIILSAQAAHAVQGGVIKNSGLLEATGISNKAGRIVLEASSLVENTGVINAGGSATGPAGSIQITAPQIINSGLITADASTGGQIVLAATDIVQTASGRMSASAVNIGAERPGNGGSIVLQAANSIRLEGSVQATAVNLNAYTVDESGSGLGGGITILAAGGITLRDAVIDASGSSSGGRIEISGGSAPIPDPLDPGNRVPNVAILGNSELRVRSSRGRAGNVLVSGDFIKLDDFSQINASGSAGGGSVLVGGDWQGSNPDFPQASRVYVGQKVILDASATDFGDGGTVVVWSSIHNPLSVTEAYGSFFAQGGLNGGNGGRIETSGHLLATAGARGSASAAHGAAGQWLFDPYNITITSANANGSFTAGEWTPSGNSSTILNTDINNLLNGGTNVLITTGAGGAQNGDITVSSAITKGSGNADVSLTLKAAGAITVNQSITNTGGTGKLNVVLHADSDNANQMGELSRATNVYINNANIATGGGNVTIGGGTDPLTGFAVGYGSSTYTSAQYGFRMDGTSAINAGGGNIRVRGRTTSTSTGGGIDIGYYGGTTVSLTTTAAGTISLTGDSANAGSYNGIEVGGSATIDGGTISLTGTAAGGFNPLRIYGGASIGATVASSITFDSYYTGTSGTGWTTIFGTFGSATPATIGNTANTTLIDFIVDRSGSTGSYGAVHAFATGVQFRGNNATLKIRPGTLHLTRGQTIGGSSDGGNWTQQLATAGSNSNLSGILPALQGAVGFSSIEIGRSDGSGATVAYFPTTAVNQNMTLLAGTGGMTLSNAAGATAFNTGTGNLTLSSSGTIAINNGVATTGTLTISPGAASSVTQNASGSITANALLLSVPGASYTLTSVTNNVATLAANVASLSYVDADAITIGTVGATNGINATGTVSVVSAAGNLTVAQNIATTSTSASAVTLNGGRTSAAGTSTGGNLLITGSPTITTGAGGRATLYSGSVAGSTGLTTLVGSASGRFRYNSDETASNFSTALGTGLHAIYREQPVLNVTADNATITYGNAYAATSSVAGLQNGDTQVQAITTAATVATGGTLSTSGNFTAGSHALTPSGAAGGLGYGFSYTAGTLTVSPATISAVTGITAANKAEDGTTAATLNSAGASFTGKIGADIVSVTGATGNFSSASAGTGKTVSITGISLAGADAANYTAVGVTASATANITAAASVPASAPTRAPTFTFLPIFAPPLIQLPTFGGEPLSLQAAPPRSFGGAATSGGTNPVASTLNASATPAPALSASGNPAQPTVGTTNSRPASAAVPSSTPSRRASSSVRSAAPKPATRSSSVAKTNGPEKLATTQMASQLNNPLLALIPSFSPSRSDWRTSPHDEMAASFDSIPSAISNPGSLGKPKAISKASETLDIVIFLTMLRLHILP